MEDTNTTARLPLRKLLQRDAIANQLKEIDEDPEPDLRKKWPKYETLSSLVRKYNEVGEILWPATVVGTCLVVAGALWLHAHWPKSYFYSYPTDYLRIVQKLNERDFMVQRVDHGVPQEQTMMRFCDDYLPWFEGGHILQWIRYNDHGSCQSMGPEDRGFDIVRDGKGGPVVAPNCRFDQVHNHIVCEGGVPKFD